MRQTQGRNAPQVVEVQNFARDKSVDLRPVELDVASDASVVAGIETVLSEHNRLDVVVHNAGHMVFGPAEAFTPEQFANLYDINVLSTQRVNRAALPYMRAQGKGLLVWVSSTSTRGGTPPFLAPYFAAKAAMDSLAVSYASELAPLGDRDLDHRSWSLYQSAQTTSSTLAPRKIKSACSRSTKGQGSVRRGGGASCSKNWPAWNRLMQTSGRWPRPLSVWWTLRSAGGRSASTLIPARMARRWLRPWRTVCGAKCSGPSGSPICFPHESSADRSRSGISTEFLAMTYRAHGYSNDGTLSHRSSATSDVTPSTHVSAESLSECDRQDCSVLLSSLLATATVSLNTNRRVTQRCIQRAALLLGIDLSSCASETAGRSCLRGGLASWQAKRVTSYIEDKLDSTIRVSDLAGIVRLSSSHFFRAFRETFGETPLTYVMKRRMVRAQQLMLTSRVPLSQVALECGMCDQAHFSRTFRRIVGANPSVCRRQFLPDTGTSEQALATG